MLLLLIPCANECFQTQHFRPILKNTDILQEFEH